MLVIDTIMLDICVEFQDLFCVIDLLCSASIPMVTDAKVVATYTREIVHALSFSTTVLYAGYFVKKS